jgi:hypothetical protein
MKTLFRYILIIYIIFFHSAKAQLIPSYSITVCDTNSSSGYYFLTAIQADPNPFNISPTHLILDKNGEVVYFKVFTSGINTGSFRLQPNGLMSYTYSDKFYLMDSTFTLVDSVSCKNGIGFDGHEFQILPDGHFLMLGFENVTMDLRSYHMFNHNGTAGSANATVKCGVIQELDSNKNVVFEWHCKDHFAFDDVYENYLYGPANVDWTHCNALDLDHDGNILLSSRYLCEITKINRNDSSVMWRIGGKNNQFTFLNDSQKFIGQHDVRRIANGNITLFDNGNGNSSVPFHPAIAKEYLIDDSLKTAELVWSYIDNISSYSKAMGNVHRLQNGNTLVNYGIITSGNTLFNVINSSGEKVFEITFQDTLESYRSFNYPELPFNIKRPEITCDHSSLDAEPGYTSYLWSTGATTRVIPITSTGNYFVMIPQANGGYICSEKIIVQNVSDPCNPDAIPDYHQVNFSLSPNPATDNIFIHFHGIQKTSVDYKITDVLGRCNFSGSASDTNYYLINISYLNPGAYFIIIDGVWQLFIKM